MLKRECKYCNYRNVKTNYCAKLNKSDMKLTFGCNLFDPMGGPLELFLEHIVYDISPFLLPRNYDTKLVKIVVQLYGAGPHESKILMEELFEVYINKHNFLHPEDGVSGLLVILYKALVSSKNTTYVMNDEELVNFTLTRMLTGHEGAWEDYFGLAKRFGVTYK